MQSENESSSGWKSNHAVAKLVIALLLIAVLVFAMYEAGLFHFFTSKKQLIRFLDSLEQWSFLGFILLQAFQVVAAPIPGDVTGFLGGYLYGPWLGILFSTIGLTLGSWAAFALSRAFGKPFVRKFVPPAARERFNYLLHHKGAFIIFLLFLIPGFPKDFLCYILGLGELSTAEFIVIGGTGRLFGTVLLTLGGAYFRYHQYGRLGIVAGIALIITFLALAYRDKLEKWIHRLHTKDDGKDDPNLPQNEPSQIK